MKTLDEQIAIMTAYKNGARVERRPKETLIWLHCDEPSWDWERVDYRAVNTPIVLSVAIRREGEDLVSSVASLLNPGDVASRVEIGKTIYLKFVEVQS